MLNTIIQICNKLGVEYSIPSNLEECDKVQYLLGEINLFLGDN